MPEQSEEAKVKEILTQFDSLKNERQHWESAWQDIIDHVLPVRVNINTTQQDPGKKLSNKTFDGTAQGALRLLKNGLHGYLVSPATTWFKMKIQDEDLNELWSVRTWLEQTEKILYHEFNRSNFYDEIGQVFRDGASLGNGCYYIEQDEIKHKINFHTIHPKELYIAQNQYSQIDTVFREFFMTGKQILSRFPDAPELVKKDCKNQPFEYFPIIHAVFPREDRAIYKIDNLNFEYASYYIFKNGCELLKESGFKKCPYIVWRWEKTTDGPYGFSPAWEAMTDIKRINRVSKTLLHSADLAVEPPVNYPKELQGELQLFPRGMNPYSSPDRQVFPMQLGGNYPVGRDREEALEQAIKDHFMVDFFLAITSQERQMTAREVAERMGEKAAVLGPLTSGIGAELLDPTIERVFDIAMEQGKIPPLPDELQELAGRNQLDIEYTGPLVQSQRRYFGTQGISQSLEMLMPLSQIKPEVLDIINWDELSKEILVSNGMPAKTMREDSEIENMRQVKAQQQAKLQQMQAIEQMGKAVPGLNQKVEEDSVLEQMGKQMGGAISGQ